MYEKQKCQASKVEPSDRERYTLSKSKFGNYEILLGDDELTSS